MRKVMRGVFAFCGVALVSLTASALNDGWIHICGVTLIPATGTNYGSSGYLRVAAYNGPQCTLGFIGNVNICSTNATNGTCASNSNYHLNSTQIMGVYDGLRDAAQGGHRVYMTVAACGDGSNNCVRQLDFSY